MTNRSGRILVAGLDSADVRISGGAADTSVFEVTARPLIEVRRAVEMAIAEEQPYQVVVLQASVSPGSLEFDIAAKVRSLDPAIHLLFAASASEAKLIERSIERSDRVFVVQRPLQPAALDLIRVLVQKRNIERSFEEMQNELDAATRAYGLVTSEFRRQSTRLTAPELAAQAGLLVATLDNMHQGLMVLNNKLEVAVFNRRLAELIGYSPEVLRVGTTAQSLIVGAVALGHYPGRKAEDVYTAWLNRLARRKASTHYQVLADGRTLAVNYRPMPGDGWVIAYEDISDQIRTKAALEQQNQRLGAALTNMPHGLCMFDAQNRLILCNAAYGHMYSLPAELLKARTPLQDILNYRSSIGNAPAKIETYFDVANAAEEKGAAADFRTDLLDGRTIKITYNPIPVGGFVATHEDITESIRAQAKIAHMARHDALTGLPNRRLLHEKIEEALARARRGDHLAVLCLDLDHFKAVNDTLGQPTGDLLLKAVTERLRDYVRETDTIALIGGDEFVIVEIGTQTPEQASALAHRVIEALASPFDLDGQQVVISANVGIALWPSDGDDADRLLKNADLALHRAKSDGRGIYRFFEPEMDAHMQNRRQLELDLRRALTMNEFLVLYQPFVDAQTETVIGFEALLRWKHPERGIVPPDEFIALAEEIGLIVPLGAWVIRQACTDAAQWPKGVKVAVNLSSVQIKSRSLVQAVISTLADTGLSPRRLELEITESVLLADSEATLAILYQLRNLGISIAMDDFGTGYSSLSYLRSFPFDKIKIDRSFVRGLTSANDCVAIVKAIAGLGADLGIATTAEGVETKEQLKQVKELGCTEVQGHYFSPGRPASEVTELLRPNKAAVA